MALAKITLWGMAKYMEDHNDDLFANLNVPAGMSRQKLIDNILYKGAEFGVLYADPYFMKLLIKTWSEKHEFTFTRWVRALAEEYNPIWNYDRTEEWNDTGSRTKSDERTTEGSRTDSGNQSRTGTSDHSYDDDSAHTETITHAETATISESNSGSESKNSTEASTTSSTAHEETDNSNDVNVNTASTKDTQTDTENKVSAYDSATYQPDTTTSETVSQNEATSTGTKSQGSQTVDGNTESASSRTGSDTTNTSGSKDQEEVRSSTDTHTIRDDNDGSTSDSYAESVQNNSTSGSSENTQGSETEATAAHKSGRAFGNIGVTSSQQLLLEEFNEVARLNIYEEAADMFLEEFCIYVY